MLVIVDVLTAKKDNILFLYILFGNRIEYQYTWSSCHRSNPTNSHDFCGNVDHYRVCRHVDHTADAIWIAENLVKCPIWCVADESYTCCLCPSDRNPYLHCHRRHGGRHAHGLTNDYIVDVDHGSGHYVSRMFSFCVFVCVRDFVFLYSIDTIFGPTQRQ